MCVNQLRARGLNIPPQPLGRKEKQRLEELISASESISLEERIALLPTRLRTVYDAINTHPDYSNRDIAILLKRKEGTVRAQTKRLEQLGFSFNEREKIEERINTDNKKRYMERNKEICAAFIDEEMRLTAIARKYDLCKQRISQILVAEGVSVSDLQMQRTRDLHTQKEKVKEQSQILVNTLMEHYFNLLRDERGFDYALAWRYQTFYAHQGKYSREEYIDELTRLIKARREGLGYYKCIKEAGIAYETFEIRKIMPGIFRILETALHDVPYTIATKRFGKKKYLTKPKEVDLFKELYTKGAPYTQIKEQLGMQSNLQHYHAAKLGISRPDK